MSKHLRNCIASAGGALGHWNDILVHKFCTALIDAFDLEGKWGWVILVTLVGFWVASMICAVHGVHFVATDLHVRFWLSGWPLCTLLGDVVLLVFLMVTATSMELLTLSRHKPRTPSNFHVWCIEPSMVCLRGLHRELTHRVLQRLCVIFFFCSVAVTCFAVNTAHRGTEVANDLLERCGNGHMRDAASRELEATWKKLDGFYEQCDPLRKKPIRTCPGFSASFPSPAPMVRYLEVLETKKGCSGFCQFGAKPLFTSGQGLSGRSQFPVRCATILSNEMRHISLGIGVPSVAFGCAIALMAFCLWHYDNL